MTIPTEFKNTLINAITPMEGWCSTDKACQIAEIIISRQITTYLEIGVFGGRSLVAAALALQQFQSPGFAYGVDPWRNSNCLEGEVGQENAEWWSKLDLHEIHKKCMEKIWELGLEGNTMVIRGTSDVAWRAMRVLRPSFIHIDGNHSELASMKDVDMWIPRLSSGGILAFDDISWPTTQNTVKYLDSKLKKLCDVSDCRFYEKS